MSGYYSGLYLGERTKVDRRKCFISYYAGDTTEVDKFIGDFDDAFIAKVVGVSNGDDFIDSDDSEYVMSRIRDKYLGDSTVTICLLGSCTHSRRFVDWELKASLRQGSYTPNGLLGILLPSQGESCNLPERFKDNWNSADAKSYARYMQYPGSTATLKEWIEDCYSRRETRAHLIANSQDMFKYNRKCIVHGQTH
jgi:hypothetical protein